jgi:serine/threonine-protein kinase
MKRHCFRPLIATALLGLAGLAFERSAFAEPSAADKAAAETLFINARKQMAEGKFAEACRGFAESQRLDSGVGTLLNLGKCYEKLGKTASAWSTYREAAAAARAARQTAREKSARAAADALEKNLPMLTVNVAGVETSPNLEVRRDGVVVANSLWGLAVAIDPGEHVFEASAPRRIPWRKTVTAQPGKPLTVDIPVLEPADAAPRNPAKSTAAATAPAAKKDLPAEPAKTEGQGIGTQRVVAIVVGAAGLVTTGVGGYYAYRAKSTYNSVTCEANGCDQVAYDQRNKAMGMATTSTVLTIGGLVAIAGSVVLWVTAPTHSDEPAAATKSRVWVSADPWGSSGARSIAVSGVF